MKRVVDFFENTELGQKIFGLLVCAVTIGMFYLGYIFQ